MKTLEDQITDILSEFITEENNILNEDLKKAAKSARNTLQVKSPKKTGKYRQGWKFKKTENGFIVYNASQPWKTHLLENGHAKKNGGRVRAIKHIAPAAEKSINELMRDLKKDL